MPGEAFHDLQGGHCGQYIWPSVDNQFVCLNIYRGPPEDIIHYFTLMSSKLTLFYIILENWTFYIIVFKIDIILHYFWKFLCYTHWDQDETVIWNISDLWP